MWRVSWLIVFVVPTWCQIVWHSYSQNKHPTFQHHNIWASSMLGRIIYKWIVGKIFRSSESTARHDISPKNKFFQSHWQLMAEWEMPGKNLFSGEITIYGKYQEIKNSIRNVIHAYRRTSTKTRIIVVIATVLLKFHL